MTESSLDNIASLNPPHWCRSGHVHTIARSLFSRPAPPPVERVEISTPDNDFLELDVAPTQPGRPVVLLLHGLEGSSRRYYIAELMEQLHAHGYAVAAMNFRGCGSRLNRQRRFYHSGGTEDIATVLAWMGRKFPDSPIGAAGFSLGGNALLKSLGELGANHPVTAAAAVSVPYHLKRGAEQIGRGFNRLYQYHFLRTLNAKLQQKRAIYPDLPRFSGSTLYEFDHQVTAPLHGFSSADDYYARCSAGRFLESIARPTLLIHSRVDPICPIDAVPLDVIRQQPSLDYIVTGQGGHVGFWSRPAGWLNDTITNYFRERLDG